MIPPPFIGSKAERKGRWLIPLLVVFYLTFHSVYIAPEPVQAESGLPLAATK